MDGLHPVQMTREQFVDALTRFRWTRRITQVHMHHTWSPARKDWNGVKTLLAMRDFHVNTNGWDDIAQHLTIAPDGTLWTGRDWNRAPASSAGFNGTRVEGPFMFETVGNFDLGHDPFDGAQRSAVLGVIVRLQLRFGLVPETLKFHRDLGSPKTCPGSGITYSDVLAAVRREHARLGQVPVPVPDPRDA